MTESEDGRVANRTHAVTPASYVALCVDRANDLFTPVLSGLCGPHVRFYTQSCSAGGGRRFYNRIPATQILGGTNTTLQEAKSFSWKQFLGCLEERCGVEREKRIPHMALQR